MISKRDTKYAALDSDTRHAVSCRSPLARRSPLPFPSKKRRVDTRHHIRARDTAYSILYNIIITGALRMPAPPLPAAAALSAAASPHDILLDVTLFWLCQFLSAQAFQLFICRINIFSGWLRYARRHFSQAAASRRSRAQERHDISERLTISLSHSLMSPPRQTAQGVSMTCRQSDGCSSTSISRPPIPYRHFEGSARRHGTRPFTPGPEMMARHFEKRFRRAYRAHFGEFLYGRHADMIAYGVSFHYAYLIIAVRFTPFAIRAFSAVFLSREADDSYFSPLFILMIQKY